MTASASEGRTNIRLQRTARAPTKDKDLAGAEGPLELVDKMVVPRNRRRLAVGLAPRRLGGVKVARHDHVTNGLEGVGDDLALGRAHDV